MGRISALTELTSLASNDYIIVLDSSANIAKKITVANAFGIPDIGWTAAGETWVYASSTTVTVPTDATTKYGVGMLVKITQTTGGTKYGTITAVASTLLTIRWRDGATLANETISTPYYSSLATPLGAGAVEAPQVDWSSFSNNIKFANNTSIITPINGSNVNGAGQGLSLSFTNVGTAYAYVTITVGTVSSTDFENKPVIYLNGVATVVATYGAAAGNASSRVNPRTWTALITLPAGANTISGGINVASATSPSVPVGYANIAAIVLGTVTA